MPKIYTSQYSLDDPVGPQNPNDDPIPGLEVLKIDDDALQLGGTANVSLYLGHAFSGDVISFSLYVTIVDAANEVTICENYMGGFNGLASVISVSAAYNIEPGWNPPVLQAYWRVEGSTGVQIMAPSLMSFTATVFENQG